MKIIRAILILSIILFVSCEDIYNTIADGHYYDNINKSDVYYNDEFIPATHNIHISYANNFYISWLIRNNITYKKDSGDYWQSAEKTWEKGTGDCEDIAILFINIKYVLTAEKCDIVLIDDDTMDYNTSALRTIEDGGYVNHAVVRDSTGRFIDPMTGRYIDCDPGFSYAFDSLFEKE